jgi:hypothetical protein
VRKLWTQVSQEEVIKRTFQFLLDTALQPRLAHQDHHHQCSHGHHFAKEFLNKLSSAKDMHI